MGPARVIGDAFYGGVLMPTVTETQDIGSSSVKWRNVYATTLNGNASSANKWKTARTLTIGNKSNSVDGTGDKTWTLQETLIRSSNEFNFTSDGLTTIYFNYRSQTGTSTGTRITGYNFCNGQGSTADVWVNAQGFQAKTIWAGLDSDTVECSVGVRSTAGTFKMYAQNNANGYRGIWVDAHGSDTSGKVVLQADKDNAIFFYGYLNGTARLAEEAETAQSSDRTRYVVCLDTRADALAPQDLTATTAGVRFDFKQKSITGLAASYSGIMSYRPYSSASDWSGGPAHQVGFDENGLHWRKSTNSTTWGTWYDILTTKDTVTVAQGGTGAATAAGARTNLGLGSFATISSLAWDGITQSGANNLNEGTSDFTDNTELLTSYASNNGFADSNSVGVVYRRDAVCMYNYIKGKASGSWGISITGNAATASSVAWDNVASKPINFKAYVGSSASGGWNALNGNVTGSSLAIAHNNGTTAANWNSGLYSASLVFGCNDTKGLLDCAFNTPIVTFGGANTAGSTNDNPVWYMKISGTTATTYNLDNFLPLSGGQMTGTITMTTTAAAAAASTPTALSYGRLQAYGTLCINANTDNSGTEYVILTAGHGISSTTTDGFWVGTDTLGSNIPYLNGGVYGGTWMSGTKQASFRVTAATAASAGGYYQGWYSGKTPSGAWSWGVLAGYEDCYFVYGSDANYNSSTNTTANIKFGSDAKVYNAVWNDYAEYRAAEETEPGRVIAPNKKGIGQKTTKRLQAGARIISDTYGMAIGETDKAKTPVGLVGRVLAYPCRNINEYTIGDCVCSAPNGTVDIMTREEIQQYPDRIIGTVDEIPDYDIWDGILTLPDGGKTGNQLKVNGRIWIDIR